MKSMLFFGLLTWFPDARKATYPASTHLVPIRNEPIFFFRKLRLFVTRNLCRYTQTGLPVGMFDSSERVSPLTHTSRFPDEAELLRKAKRRLDHLDFYPEPVRINGVRIRIAPWLFRIPGFRRFRGYATRRNIWLKRHDRDERLIAHELCHVWQLQHRPLRVWLSLRPAVDLQLRPHRLPGQPLRGRGAHCCDRRAGGARERAGSPDDQSGRLGSRLGGLVVVRDGLRDEVGLAASRWSPW